MNQQRYNNSRIVALRWTTATLVCFVVILSVLQGSIAWQQQHRSTSSSFAFRSTSKSSSKPSISMYMPSNGPTSQPPSFTAQKMLLNPGVITSGTTSAQQRMNNKDSSSASKGPSTAGGRSKRSMKLSNSVLASCDTLPSFPTAHGLLSPETVMRLDENTKHKSDALRNFLDTYRRQGPMSCLPMLSDPDVLPHLTQAMRDITA